MSFIIPKGTWWRKWVFDMNHVIGPQIMDQIVKYQTIYTIIYSNFTHLYVTKIYMEVKVWMFQSPETPLQVTTAESVLALLQKD